MRSLAGHSFGIYSFSFADKLKTHWFGNAVIDNKGRKQLEYFIFVQKDLSVPDNVELFISCIQSVYHVDVIHLYNLSVWIAIEWNCEGLDVIKWYFLADFNFSWNIRDIVTLPTNVNCL